MASDGGHADQVPFWWVLPNESDQMAWTSAIGIALAVYFIVYLYAKFDRWAEHKSSGTPLAKTIPTLLAIALLYELFPLDHFHVLLPLSAILLAVAADWVRYRSDHDAAVAEDEPDVDVAGNVENAEIVTEEPASV